ncbi:MAG: hypothetical protein IIB82_07160, partial [Bacteroidetes bacterium]|nr:hypothetical protein [Bacteroidota bacterium]
KGEVSKVIANLTKQKSSAATKLATRYKQIDSAQKKITEQRNTLNLEMTEYVSSLFDAEDAIYTRVVDTASMILTLSKAQKGTKVSVNFEKILEEILKIVPELTSQVDSLLKKYTVIKEFEKKAALRTPKLKGEGVLDKIIKKFKDFMLKFRNNIIS